MDYPPYPLIDTLLVLAIFTIIWLLYNPPGDYDD
jgi:hypothetical protein